MDWRKVTNADVIKTGAGGQRLAGPARNRIDAKRVKRKPVGRKLKRAQRRSGCSSCETLSSRLMMTSGMQLQSPLSTRSAFPNEPSRPGLLCLGGSNLKRHLNWLQSRKSYSLGAMRLRITFCQTAHKLVYSVAVFYRRNRNFIIWN